MRGKFQDQGGLFSYISSEKRVAANHPLRKIRELVRDVLKELTHSLGKLYASDGRPSVPPEQLLSALLLQVFYGIRSERQLMEQLDYNLPYRWLSTFAGRFGVGPDDLHQEPRPPAGGRCLSKIHEQAAQPSAGKAVVIGRTLFGGWHADRSLGSQKSFRPKDGSEDDGRDFHGQKRLHVLISLPLPSREIGDTERAGCATKAISKHASSPHSRYATATQQARRG
jgi:hypothetical protein